MTRDSSRAVAFVLLLLFLSAAISGCPSSGGDSSRAPAAGEFVNWESPHVSPLALTPNGKLLLAVNTPDNRLEVFDVTGSAPSSLGSVPVGLDPVTVRARSDAQAWVVNQISDSVSIVDLQTRNVVKTLQVGDEPGDVVFAAGRAFVTCSALNQIWVFDLQDLTASPVIVQIAGKHPRALAVSPDGTKVFAAIFESGNDTTIVPDSSVSRPEGPYGGMNPPPNRGDAFDPPMDPALPRPPRVSQIVRKDTATGEWMDDNSQIWPTSLVTWDLLDHDVAVIDATALSVGYVSGLMNLDMHLAVRSDGVLMVVGTEATNQIRFEPNLRGKFVHSVAAVVDLTDSAARTVFDLNPHLAQAYAKNEASVSPEERALSLADPRAVVWRRDGRLAYVAGMGSNNVVFVTPEGGRHLQLDVGQGPTGLAIDDDRERLYVLNRFDATISVIDTSAEVEIRRVAMYDPTPVAIRSGRPMLYDAHRTSGLGVTACASCHVDARMDEIAWDLGDPGGAMKSFNQTCDKLGGFLTGQCEDYHPMKGPMMTQTLQGIVGEEPLHWRGDREDLVAFNPAFISLLGADRALTDDEMQKFVDFVATIRFPPNPNRNIDNSLRESAAGGHPIEGERLFNTALSDRGLFNCVQCHSGPLGSSLGLTPARSLTLPQSFKIAPLHNQYRKASFDKSARDNISGFGFAHDGQFANLIEFFHFRVFQFAGGDLGEQQRRDVVSFVMSFATETHSGVGKQITLDGANNASAGIVALTDTMRQLADRGEVGLVVRGRRAGSTRGFAYVGKGTFQSDRANERVSLTDLRNSAAPGNELTWTLVPPGMETRVGIDRDMDGRLDGDELSAGTDPANPDPSVLPGVQITPSSVRLKPLPQSIRRNPIRKAPQGGPFGH